MVSLLYHAFKSPVWCTHDVSMKCVTTGSTVSTLENTCLSVHAHSFVFSSCDYYRYVYSNATAVITVSEVMNFMKILSSNRGGLVKERKKKMMLIHNFKLTLSVKFFSRG